MNRILTLSTLVCAALISTASGEEWAVDLTPYGWLSGLDGTTKAQGISSEIDQSFSDILENLDFAAMLAFDAGNGTWGGLGDVNYVALEGGRDTSLGTLSAEVEQWVVTAAPYYRVASREGMTFDLGAGVRFVDLDLDVTTPRDQASGTRNWVDPLILARVRVLLTERIFVSLMGNIGGFGAASDLAWELFAATGYTLNDRVDLLVGYRHLDIDFEDGDFTYDVATSGLAIGIRLGF
jgi:hypothetical protein